MPNLDDVLKRAVWNPLGRNGKTFFGDSFVQGGDSMGGLLPDAKSFKVKEIISVSEGVILRVARIGPLAKCPGCGNESRRIHSRYLRVMQDLPFIGAGVRLELEVRRFVCSDSICRQSIFAEPMSEIAEPYSRMTTRLRQVLRQLGGELGGMAAKRIGGQLHIKTSRNTILRTLRAKAELKKAKPRVVGIDDFAFRRGKTYGSIIVDHETRRVIDLLPNREPETIAAWFADHPEIKTVTRDRGNPYIGLNPTKVPKISQGNRQGSFFQSDRGQNQPPFGVRSRARIFGS